MIDILFVTNIPSFYKIKLYNKIAEKLDIFVIFCYTGSPDRTNDFYNEAIKFQHCFIPNGNCLSRIHFFLKQLMRGDYEKIVITGWDSPYYWLAAFLSPKKRNFVGVESSRFESKSKGPHGAIKRFFLGKFTGAYVPGENNKRLLQILGFKGSIIKTYGVGLYNRVEPPQYKVKTEVSRFLYVGRLVGVKNLGFLISVFNEFPHLSLNIIGYGELLDNLEAIAGANIHFIGEIKNAELPAWYRKNDVFVLPSLSEPWGLVVEEALNNGLPVIASSRVGCAGEILHDGVNGLVFEIGDKNALKAAIENIINPEVYNRLRKNVCAYDYEKHEKKQIEAYNKL